MLNPYLGADEQFFSGDVEFLDSAAYLFLIEIGLDSIDWVVSHLYGIHDTVLTFVIGDLIKAITQLRNFYLFNSSIYYIICSLGTPRIFKSLIRQKTYDILFVKSN